MTIASLSLSLSLSSLQDHTFITIHVLKSIHLIRSCHITSYISQHRIILLSRIISSYLLISSQLISSNFISYHISFQLIQQDQIRLDHIRYKPPYPPPSQSFSFHPIPSQPIPSSPTIQLRFPQPTVSIAATLYIHPYTHTNIHTYKKHKTQKSRNLKTAPIRSFIDTYKHTKQTNEHAPPPTKKRPLDLS